MASAGQNGPRETRGKTGKSREAKKPEEDVEKALLDRCLGYTMAVKKTYKLKHVEYGENGRKISEKEELQTGVDEIHVPGDTGAQKFWLVNRRHDRWQSRPEPPADEAGLKRAEELLGGVDSALS